MYGWRGLLGVISPTYRGRMAEALFSLCPNGVGIIPAPLGISEGSEDVFQASFDEADRIARTLARWNVDVMTQPGIPPWTVKGETFEAEWVRRIQDQTGVPFVTPMQASTQALQAVGGERVLLIHYFGRELSDGIASYLHHRGLDVVEAPGYTMTGETEGLYTTPLIELSKVTYDVVYRFVREQARTTSGIDSVFVIGGGWDCFAAIDPLEYDLGVPVIYAPTATFWACLNTVGVREPINGHGRLLSELANWWHPVSLYESETVGKQKRIADGPLQR